MTKTKASPELSHAKRRPRDPDRTRRRLLEVARRQFAEKGFAGARVDEVVRLAGMNKQAVYYHFGSKEDLFRAALESGYEQFRQRDRDLNVKSGSPEEALAHVIGVTYDDLQQSPELLAMIGDENRQKGRHLNRKRVRAINIPLVRSIKDVLARGEKERIFRRGVDPEQFYVSVMSLLQFYFTNVYTLSAVLGRDLRSETAIRKRRAHVIDLLLHSIRR